jgi:hypothetical protein
MPRSQILKDSEPDDPARCSSYSLHPLLLDNLSCKSCQILVLCFHDKNLTVVITQCFASLDSLCSSCDRNLAPSSNLPQHNKVLVDTCLPLCMYNIMSQKVFTYHSSKTIHILACARYWQALRVCDFRLAAKSNNDCLSAPLYYRW